MARLYVRIDDTKKSEFEKAIQEREPNLNMSIVIKNLIDLYLKGGK